MEERREFPGFPYEPYSIQLDFMKALYQSLNKGGVAMLESPTGTGKTLSIICSALQWLVDKKQHQKNHVDSSSNFSGKKEDELGVDDEPDWMRNFVIKNDTKSPEKKTKEKKKMGFNKKIDRKGERENVRDLVSNRGEKAEDTDIEKVNNLQTKHEDEGMDEEEFLVEEYESEDENGGRLKRRGGGVSVNSSSEEEKDEDSMEDEEDEARPKIYFCSRTHSQLSQFIKELRKTKFADEVKVVCLGSRKNFCINQEVLKLGSSTQINERCLELQKSRKKEISKKSKTKNTGAGGRVRRSKTSSGCPMLRNHKRGKEFRSEASQQGPLDIEDLVQIGHDFKTCPYYGSRSLVHTADLVVLPYQSLLSKSSRESLGLSLKDSVIVVDEAHNLADSLVSMYNSKITLSQLELVHSHLESYFIHFCNLLGPGNRRYIQIMMVLTRAFLQVLRNEDCQSNFDPVSNAEGSKTGFESSMAINEFLFSQNIDNINLFKLVRYIEESTIMHKVCGYRNKLAFSEEVSASKNDGESSHDESALSGFQALVSILLSLTNKDGDGRIIISRTKPKCSMEQGGFLKYVMLTGEKIFSEILNQAHAVILAGGTLQPIEETKERLFPWLPPDQLHFFSCGHIIPSENILPIVVPQGPSGHSFDFSYSVRSSSVMIQELGLLISNLVNIVPEGMVLFFSSFDYEGQVYDAWKESGIIGRIMKKKRIFREPRSSTDVETVLKEYKETIDALSHNSSKRNPESRNGAILLAIVGGKVSEGINFSDGMGRCMVMVGLPYPNPADIELMERIKHIEGFDTSVGKNTKFQAERSWYSGDAQAGLHILKSCKHRGKQYYENLCMKAVNQSIGRAIRHINDYAAILLVDKRYTYDPSERNFSHSTNKLPQWIKGHLVSGTKNYGELQRLLHQFFKFHKGKEDNR
ncbi:putative Peroxidase 48-like [Capsicum annuum]|uniref:ATP-dependent DNA helicase DDX11 n=1 Tax=Capsicum annuum TaxID=4072 RepID=UPI0007BEE7D9|nr:ATP-dependent DNA helicase DDX11 [Capsicum annuum]KAF3641252.1 putative Peroxidase 48-like [Capsicum annuum]